MTKARTQVNADAYIKAKMFKSQRKTRAKGPRQSEKDAAIRKRRSRLNLANPYSATLARDGFQVYRDQWTTQSSSNICKYLREVSREHIGSKYHELRRDPHKLSFHVDLFHKAVKQKAIEVTNSLGLSGTIAEQNIVCVVTHQGAKKQSDHVDTNDIGAFSVLHMMTGRTIWIGNKQYEVKARDVLVMKGGLCHAGAEHTKERPSMMLHVPVGCDDIYTFPCK